MIAHILNHCGINSVGFIGGVLQGYESNLILHNPEYKDAVVVVEADEFDRSFLHLHPNNCVITSADADHLDIYGSHQELKNSFNLFIQNIKAGGNIFVHEGIEELFDIPKNVKGEKYGIGCTQNGAFDLKVKNGRNTFTFEEEDVVIKDILLKVPGIHNIENACAAIAVSLKVGLHADQIKDAIGTYRGVKRRFEFVIERDDLIYIDDYAHHPREIEALIKSVRMLYPEKRITAVFQPHLYSRTKDFAEGFAKSLDLADEVLLMEIYPAREEPIPGVTSNLILEKMHIEKKWIVKDDQVLAEIKAKKPELVLTIGAGDIDKQIAQLKENL